LTDSLGQLLTGPQKTDLTDGGATALHQHVAGATASVLVTLLNRTGGQRTAGDVVVTHPGADNSFVGTAVEGYAGKVLVVAETIENLATGTLWERGGPFDVEVEGAVTWNDGLRTSGTLYLAEAAPSPTGTGVFAIALEQAAAPTGTVSALFLDELGGPGGAGDGAPVDAKYVVTEAHGDLTAEVVRPQFGKYLPDTPPPSPGTYGDEFDSTIIDGKWSRSSLNLGTVDILVAPATQEGTMLIQPGPNATWSTIFQTSVSLSANCRIVAKAYPAATWGADHRGTFSIGINDNTGTEPEGGGAAGNDGFCLGIKVLTFNPGGALNSFIQPFLQHQKFI